MKRLLVLCALESIVLLGCSLQIGHVLQILSSPNGSYQAVVLDCRDGKSDHFTLFKVVRAGEPMSCEAKSLQKMTFPSGLQPRIAWMSDNALVIDERGAPSRPTMQGEVSLVFSSWQVVVSPLDSMNLADADVPTPATASVASAPPVDTVDPTSGLAGQNAHSAANTAAEVAASERMPKLHVPPVKIPPSESVCSFPGLTLPADFAVLVGGAFEGKESTVRIDQSGRTATTMSVSVDNPQKPVVLMLGAHSPTIWSIQRSPGTTILAVLASGFHRQVVTGLDATTPVAIHTHDNESPCGYFLVDMETRHLQELNPVARRFFGREIDMVHPAYKGVVSIGLSPSKTFPWLSRGDAPAESYIDRTPLPPSVEESLDEAVRKGLLRRANEGDMYQWEKKKMAQEKKMARLVSRRGSSRIARGVSALHLDSWPIDLSEAYVVLRPMKLPPSLYGSKSAVFFVPKGTERPRGDPGHSTIYDFNDMSCTGTKCRLFRRT